LKAAILAKIAKMANNRQILNKISNDMQRVPFESDDFDVVGKKFRIHGSVNIQIVDLYGLVKGSL